MSRKDPPSLDDADRELLLGALPGARLAPARKDALWQRIAAQPPAQDQPSKAFEIVRADSDDWRPFLPGLRIKPLRIDEAGRTQTSLWRLDPGGSVPAHNHDAEEECLILEGTLVWGERTYVAGDYLVAQPGGEHSEFTSPGGALFLIRSELTEPLRRLFSTPKFG